MTTLEIHNGEVYYDSQKVGYVTTVNQSDGDFTGTHYLGQRLTKVSYLPSNIEITMSITAPIDISSLMRSTINSPSSMGYSTKKGKNLQMEEEYLEKIDSIIHDEEE